MIKKIVLLLALILTIGVGCMKGQLAVGDWRIHPMYSGQITKMIDTQNKVYILAGTNLYSYDKSSDLGEVYAYTSRNVLSENQVSNIYYNKDSKYLMAIYNDSNIDLIYDDGEVVNMSEIKDAIMQNKTINDVAFDSKNSKIYIATAFGLVIYDDKKHYVIESGNYNKGITGVGIVGDNLIISDNEKLAYCNISSKINSLDIFTSLGSLSKVKSIQGISDTKALVLNGTNVQLVTFNFAANTINTTNLASGVSNIGVSSTDYYYTTSTSLTRVDSEGKTTSIALPEELKNNVLSYWNDTNNLWAASNDLFNIKGIGNYNVSNNGTFTVLKDRFVPDGMSTTTTEALYFSPSGKLYVNSSFSNYYGSNMYLYSPINTYKDGIWNDITIVKPEQSSGNYFETAAVTHVVEDPENPDTYYYGNFWKGVRKVVNRESKIVYDIKNSSLTSLGYDKDDGFAVIACDLDFDNNKNLWVLTKIDGSRDVSTLPALHVLPAEKRKLSETTINDWVYRPLPQADIEQGAKMLVCKKSDMVFIINVKYGGILTAVYTNGTPTDFSDDTVTYYKSFVDQDGKSFAPEYLLDIIEDKNGKVWIGTTDGVIELPRPEEYKKENVSINRIKVPRNDGTMFADYLLDGQVVSAISVDASNRKWLGTTSTGIYLVNETGSEILEKFNTENSYIPSDCVYDIACDPNSTSIFIGTDNGLAEYVGNSSPAAEDYSEVYAYPNPVRPDYTGWITVTGLMDNSLVKIADAAGNVLYTTTSEGGMITWDGCNSAGERVKTGVYYVFASQNETGNASGVVTKILVVK